MTQHSRLHNSSLLSIQSTLAALLLELASTCWTEVPVRTEKLPDDIQGTTTWGNGHIKERYLYYNYVKENDTSYAVEYINSDWCEVNLNQDRKFYTKLSLKLNREDTQHLHNTEYQWWKLAQTCETQASSSSNLITSSEKMYRKKYLLKQVLSTTY